MWIYLSPHFDDAALSAGGLIWEQVQAGERVEVWTLFGGDPPLGAADVGFARELHARWEAGANPVAARRREDRAACRILGAGVRVFAEPDAIYRAAPGGGPLIRRVEDLWQQPVAAALVAPLAEAIAAALPAEAQVVAPLTLGGHHDHRLARAAAERLGRRLYYYPDYPYAVGERGSADGLIDADWEPRTWSISPAGLDAWQRAVAAHRSQISSFWSSLAEMRAAIADYLAQGGGTLLWHAKPPPGPAPAGEDPSQSA